MSRRRVPPRPAHDPGQRPRRHWSLRTRLLVSSIALIAVVAAVIGTVTTLALQSYLSNQLNTQMVGVAKRAEGPPSSKDDTETELTGSGLGFLDQGGQPVGTLGATLNTDGQIGDAAVLNGNVVYSGAPQDGRNLLTDEAKAVLSTVPLDKQVHAVEIPGLGDYLLQSVTKKSDGSTVIVGLSMADNQETIATLLLVEVCVTAAGLLAAAIAGFAVIRVSLQPLRRVAATASRVSELPLDRGEVALYERVPEADTDPHTEVGQVGAALNRLLGHVGSALEARQESETRVRQFVADASHELRTPLASIRGYAELTRRGREEIGPDTRHAIGRIESEAGRMTTLVEDLLLLARLDAGRPLSHEDIDLSPLVVDAVSDAWAASPTHDWRLDLPDEPVVVKGDPARLHQVLTNLLANARTHTPHGTTVCARVSRYNGKVALEIMDNGPGIPPDFVPHIFERFARGDASRSRVAGSTGLGLAIVTAVVTAHNGHVGVESQPGLTIFRVLLPAVAPESSWDSQAAQSYATQS